MDDEHYMDAIYQLRARRRSRWRIYLLLRAYSWIGVMLAIIAGGYFLLTLLSFELSAQQRIALIAAGVGVVLALMSRAVIAFYRERDAEEVDRAQEYEGLNFFLAAWQQFERVSRDMMAEEGRDLNIHSPRAVVSHLYAEGKVDREDVMVLEEGLKMRNLIVHGEWRMSAQAVGRMTESLVEITRKIARPAQ